MHSGEDSSYIMLVILHLIVLKTSEPRHGAGFRESAIRLQFIKYRERYFKQQRSIGHQYAIGNEFRCHLASLEKRAWKSFIHTSLHKQFCNSFER